MKIKSVFFDIDGTLVDTNDAHVLAWQEAFARQGIGVETDILHDQIGKGGDMLVPTLIPDADDGTQKVLGQAQGEIFKSRYLEHAVPFTGAHDLLARVRDSGRTVVLASSASANEVAHYVDLLDARDIVGAATSADDVEKTKPEPDIFEAALQRVGLAPDEVIVVGDTPYDVEAAAKCGITAVAVRSGKFSDEVLNYAGAIALYDDVAAVLADFDNSPLAR